MTDSVGAQEIDEAREAAFVAAMIARAGLKLPAAQIADLVTAYRSDRAGFERMRLMLADADETTHTFRATWPAETQP